MDSCQSPLNIMRDLDSKMVKFFHSILKHEKNKRKNLKALMEVITAYSKETISSGNSNIRFCSKAKRCAYVYRNCACTATATAYHFLQMLKNDAMLLRRMTFSDCFRLCCLGGGPGTEIAAMAKVLDGLVRSCCPTRRKPLVIKATVIDIDSGWSMTAENLARKLFQLVDPSLVRCELNFVETNLIEPFTTHVTEALEEADCVTMVRFLSAVRGSKFKDKSDQMLQEDISHIKEDGTLFFLDSPWNMHSNAIRNAIGSFPEMVETYGPLVFDLYKMSVYSVADSLKLYKKYFKDYPPAIMATVYVNAWNKGKVPLPANSPEKVEFTAGDVESRDREAVRHIAKCLKFCFPRQKDEEDFETEGVFEHKVMFTTKSKNKRILMTFEI